jgi:hypothetical protein
MQTQSHYENLTDKGHLGDLSMYGRKEIKTDFKEENILEDSSDSG